MKLFKKGDIIEFVDEQEATGINVNSILIFIEYRERVGKEITGIDSDSIFFIKTYDIKTQTMRGTYSDLVQKLERK